MQRLGDAAEFDRMTAELESRRDRSTGLTLETQAVVHCPRCNGAEFLRCDVPVEHPDFGKIVPCPDCKAGQLEARRRAELLGNSGVDKHRDLTFDSLSPRPGQHPAWSALQAFVEEPGGCIWLHGPTRAGKTTLALMTANALLDRNRQVVFRMVSKLMDTIFAVIDSGSTSLAVAMELVTSADVLILDEYGRQSPGQATTARLFQILNERMFDRRPMIVTTNKTIDQLDEALRGRVLDPRLCVPIEVGQPDQARRGTPRGSAR
jgi:DNA replication protein DnaC